MSKLKLSAVVLVFLGTIIVVPTDSVRGGPVYNITIDGSDAIFLAGRTDVTIPPASDPWDTGTYLRRHLLATPEEIQETLPPIIPVSGGDIIRAQDPAKGGVNFFNEFGPGSMGWFGPSGNGLGDSNLDALDGISGYIGPQGPLAGVFLDGSIPSGSAPTTLDFSPTGLGLDFLQLTPSLGQVFYIGDGVTSSGVFHKFIAPPTATRLALGIPDGFYFRDHPGAYDDNDGSYRVTIAINEIPPVIPAPTSLTLGMLGLLSVGAMRRKLNKKTA